MIKGKSMTPELIAQMQKALGGVSVRHVEAPLKTPVLGDAEPPGARTEKMADLVSPAGHARGMTDAF